MSTVAPPSTNTTGKNALLPPEEKFWERYSPHNEAPLSGVSSSVLHILIIGLIIGVVWLQSFLKIDEEHRSLPVEPIKFSKAGGGGSRSGSGDGIGDTLPGEVDGGLPAGDPNRPDAPPVEHAPLDPSKAPKATQEYGEQLVKRPTPQFGSLNDLSDAAQKKLRKSVAPRGQGGSGSGGGRDTGKDVGEGSGTGAGKAGVLTKREKRNMRWVLSFNTRSGQDYLNQIASLDGFIAIPIDEEKGRYNVIRNAKNPVPKEEDVSTLDRIFWIDNDPGSAAALFGAMKMQVPPRFVIFLSQKVEADMLRKELAFTERRYKTRDEEKIQETYFDLIKEGENYEVKVNRVILKR